MAHRLLASIESTSNTATCRAEVPDRSDRYLGTALTQHLSTRTRHSSTRLCRTRDTVRQDKILYRDISCTLMDCMSIVSAEQNVRHEQKKSSMCQKMLGFLEALMCTGRLPSSAACPHLICSATQLYFLNFAQHWRSPLATSAGGCGVKVQWRCRLCMSQVTPFDSELTKLSASRIWRGG